MSEPLIDDDTPGDVLFPPGVSTGLVPRDTAANPAGCYAASAVDVPLIPRSEWSARIKEMEATKSRLSDIRMTGNAGQPIPSLDQNPWGYCWGHGPAHAVMILRAVMNLPYVPLSAFAVCATLMNGRNEGAWAALALDFIRERGIPAQSFWPQKSADLGHGTPDCWTNAKLHRVAEGWMDLTAPVYNRDLSWDQTMSLLLSGVPVCADLMWWGHSVCYLDPVEVEPGSFGVRLWNSWSDAWGDRGMAVLRGDRATPDNAVAPRAVTASVN